MVPVTVSVTLMLSLFGIHFILPVVIYLRGRSIRAWLIDIKKICPFAGPKCGNA